MDSLDLSAAFDVVNIELLLNILLMIDLMPDVIQLISIWLTSRYFHLSLDGNNCFVYRYGSNGGMIQDSVLGQSPYSSVSQLFKGRGAHDNKIVGKPLISRVKLQFLA